MGKGPFLGPSLKEHYSHHSIYNLEISHICLQCARQKNTHLFWQETLAVCFQNALDTMGIWEGWSRSDWIQTRILDIWGLWGKPESTETLPGWKFLVKEKEYHAGNLTCQEVAHWTASGVFRHNMQGIWWLQKDFEGCQWSAFQRNLGIGLCL